MDKDMIAIVNDIPRVGTKIIAEGFSRRHDNIIRLVDKYKKEFEELTSFNEVSCKLKNKRLDEYMLDEDQFAFLAMLFKNNPQVVRFKLNLVKEFAKCRKRLARALNQKHDHEWKDARLTAKTLRKLETGAIQEFIEYAKKQGGSDGCDNYYANITKMVNCLLFICEGKFKNLRNILTPEQLMIVGSTEQMIGKSLRDDMANGVFYKEIYKNLKSKVVIFAELHGQSEVINQHLLQEEIK